jgi:hypothetical protein
VPSATTGERSSIAYRPVLAGRSGSATTGFEVEAPGPDVRRPERAADVVDVSEDDVDVRVRGGIAGSVAT